MAITSQVRGAGHLGEVELQAWRLAGLLKPSVVKPVLATVEKGLVRRKLGPLEASDAADLRAALATIVG
jgi:mRNA interferase MazF